jgi:hypothetical protein
MKECSKIECRKTLYIKFLEKIHLKGIPEGGLESLEKKRIIFLYNI